MTDERKLPPNAYDAEGLKTLISEQAAFFRSQPGRFYDTQLNDPQICQGDVLRLDAEIPIIDEDGEAATDGQAVLWLAIGNSCDFERENEMFTQIVPIFALEAETTDAEIADIRSYMEVRSFYLYPLHDDVHHVAAFMMPVTLHKGARRSGRVEIVARLSDAAWYLLHACLVRFLARGDNRLR